MPLTVAIHSALTKLDKSRCVEIKIVSADISTENQTRADRILKNTHPNAAIEWINIDLQEFSTVNVRHYTASTLVRLIVERFYDVSVSRVLYLDCDIVVEADISDLWAIDLGDTAVWATQNGHDDDLQNVVNKIFPEVYLPESGRYFNAGVLLINLPAWRKQAVGQRALAILLEHSETLSYPDQDALNLTLLGDWGKLPQRWNKQTIRIGQPESADLDEPGIVHYTSHKPWKSEYSGPAMMVFHKAYMQSGWQGKLAASKITLKLILSQIAHRYGKKIWRRMRRLWWHSPQPRLT